VVWNANYDNSCCHAAPAGLPLKAKGLQMCRTAPRTFVSVIELLVSLNIIISDGVECNSTIAASLNGQPLASSATTKALARVGGHRIICMTVFKAVTSKISFAPHKLCWTNKLSSACRHQ
jgi:hypothetical protein